MSKNLVQELKEEIFKKRPILKEIYEKNKSLTLEEFIKLQFEVLENPHLNIERKSEVIKAISDQAGKILGSAISESIEKQLKKQFCVVTADHHGPISHQDFVNSNLLNSFYYMNSGDTDLNNVIVLSCANVSFDNFTFPRGHLLHGFSEGQYPIFKMPFFAYKVHSLSVYGYPPYNAEGLGFTRQRIDEWVNEGVLRVDYKARILDLIEGVYSKPEVLALDYYSDQVTLTNFYIWKYLFNSAENPPNLVYLELESLVNEIIVKHHLENETLINQLLFSEKHQELLMKYFDKVDSAFNLEEKSGTFLFWGLPKEQKYRVQLWKEGNKLVSSDRSFSLELTPENIVRAIKDKELIPSTMLSFIILSLYYGLTLIGGGGQTTYLTEMKKAYSAMAQELGDLENSSIAEGVVTEKLAFLYPGIAFVECAQKELIPATLIDIILHSEPETISTLNRMSKAVTFEQAFSRALPYLYRIIFSKDSQNPEMLRVTTDEIDKATGFDLTIQPLGKFTVE